MSQVTLRLPDDLVGEVEELAGKMILGRSKLVELMLRDGVDRLRANLEALAPSPAQKIDSVNQGGTCLTCGGTRTVQGRIRDLRHPCPDCRHPCPDCTGGA